uniref:Uncharacterized protein n=1 Tax=Solanum lycopersicum TaxID=4081 RepID=A0A3Q7JKK3_SOLLC
MSLLALMLELNFLIPQLLFLLVLSSQVLSDYIFHLTRVLHMTRVLHVIFVKYDISNF